MLCRCVASAWPALPAVLTLFLVLTPSAPGADPVEDYARIDPQQLGIKLVEAARDQKTGFVVGGKNPTSLLSNLPAIAGKSIADLEADMRPGALSSAGFLGKEERLLDVLAADNRLVVDELGLTHQELARHMLVLGAVAAREAKDQPREITYHGKKFKVKATFFKAFVRSPFEDGTKTNCEATVENVGNGKKVAYSLLVPEMIERYGFYEGKGTRFRVEPRTIVEVLDFLKPAKPR
jgi:hypothetical protein